MGLLVPYGGSDEKAGGIITVFLKERQNHQGSKGWFPWALEFSLIQNFAKP